MGLMRAPRSRGRGIPEPASRWRYFWIQLFQASSKRA